MRVVLQMMAGSGVVAVNFAFAFSVSGLDFISLWAGLFALFGGMFGMAAEARRLDE
jgi:hypothetical protein